VSFLNSFLQQAVDPFLKLHQQALDYGCGPGPVLQQLLQARGVVADVYDPHFSPERPRKVYDLVTCTEAIEHVYNPQEIWANFVSYLKPGGYLCLMTLFHHGVKGFPTWWYRRDSTHVSFYSPATFAWIEQNYPLKLVMINGVDVVVFRKT